jgi:hypothetical protein
MDKRTKLIIQHATGAFLTPLIVATLCVVFCQWQQISPTAGAGFACLGFGLISGSIWIFILPIKLWIRTAIAVPYYPIMGYLMFSFAMFWVFVLTGDGL